MSRLLTAILLAATVVTAPALAQNQSSASAGIDNSIIWSQIPFNSTDHSNYPTLNFTSLQNDTTVRYFADPYGKPPVDGSDAALEAIYRRNIASISAINRQRGVRTIWIGQLLNRDRLTGDGRYGWLPLVRDRDLWPLQQRFNALLQREAEALGDIYVGLPPDSFTAADFVDQGHFSPQGARRFADALAPVVRQECAP